MAVPMANDPPFATLNHFVADLGIPNESDLLRIGISDRSRAGQACHPDAARWRLAIDDRDALTSTPRAALIVAIDRGVPIAGAKNFRPALEHPLRIRFANFSLLRGGGSEKQISMAPK